MPISWRPLPVSSKHHAHLPPLLISTAFTSNSYTVHLTDLTHLWSESLDRKDIIRRSLSEDTSIDPSEDAEQFRRVLGELKRAIVGEKDTALSLSLVASSEPVPNLDLHVRVKLPAPLKALEWPMHFEARPQSALTARLTIPLLRAQNARMREMASLVELLREKDAVIQKLVDKLEATGAELGHVFPAAAGKGGRKIARKVAEERVKGLGMFGKEDWGAEMKALEEEGDKDEVADVVSKIFAAGSGTQLGSGEEEIYGARGEWWEKLENGPMEFSKENSAEDVDSKVDATISTHHLGREDSPAKEDDDDFQIQATPPQLRGQSPTIRPDSSKKAKIIAIVDSTDDEEDLDVPSQRSAVPDSYPFQKNSTARKLGTIGRSKPATDSPAKGPARQPKSQFMRFSSDEETATEEEDAAPEPKLTAPPPAPRPLKGGLGKIGGRQNQPAPGPVPALPPQLDLPDRLHHKPKLGHIGLKVEPGSGDAAGPGSGNDESEGVLARRAEEIVEPRETDEQRADRKREELKRQLEEKARAPPAKKKRKF